ncbi:MAG: hypothetical protein DHS20C18_22770 [Saprospiraceae bacterium]|nr:MAG: hypothetical protein DHS20C18_22770 [Saprospiraceae bacterium]
MQSIDTVQHLTAVQFNKLYFQENKPVIIKGGVKEAKSYNHWSLDYLKSKFANRPVRVFYSESGYYNFNVQGQMVPIQVSFEEATEYFTSNQYNNKSYYMQQVSIPDVFPELMDDLETPEWNLPSDLINVVNLWIGGAGCVTPLHYDFAQNFLIQIMGRKELTLFAPTDAPYLYPSEAGKVHLSQINLDAVDYAQFPLFRQAKPFRCSLEPGDVLFLPPGWWHHVRSLDAAISVNYWWNRFELIPGIGMEQYPVAVLTKEINRFLEAGLPIDHQDAEGEFLLINAIGKGYVNIVEAFLSLGANANLVSTHFRPGKTALEIATASGQHKMVSLLQQYGAKEKQPNASH